jgi:hypothetical protein
MVSFIVIEVVGGKVIGLGAHEFKVAPRTGEFVTLSDENDIGQAYRVKAVIHPLEPASHAGDIYLEYFGTNLDLISALISKPN